MDLLRAADAHKKRFGDVPNLFAFPREAHSGLALLLQEAVERGRALTYEEALERLEVEPPAEDELL